MMSSVLYLLFTLAFVTTFGDVRLTVQDEFILCRSCGSDLASSESIISKTSSRSWYSFNDTLYSKEVLVQVFSTSVFFHYPVISFSLSTCVPTGEWEESTSWFPGYRWKPCVCPDCGAYVGFVFEPINLSLEKPSKTFYGLIMTTLISESFLNSLTVYPEGTSN
ncbi:protein cereblon homolog isoform X2 [Trichoplusia ni]|uniref:Protein cereblon homolog isoform X2 n=1 Tax=Trichoplusia ni TaxID=7111 RepID=A0A7E5VDB8_TRINI|nr:protein cereblon homolog isoform X2 [Trichoplusia ni]XP_026746418.1 protein cereblon homolog isoform X2 [Trichoplusia ni]